MRPATVLGKSCRFGHHYVAQTDCQWVVQARAALLLLFDNRVQLQPVLAVDELGNIREIGQSIRVVLLSEILVLEREGLQTHCSLIGNIQQYPSISVPRK